MTWWRLVALLGGALGIGVAAYSILAHLGFGPNEAEWIGCEIAWGLMGFALFLGLPVETSRSGRPR
jgi:hypothetical protein